MRFLATQLHLSARGLLRHPRYLATAVTCLALAMSTNTAMFSFVDAALFRPFAYPDADALVAVVGYRTASPGVPMPISFADFQSFGRLTHAFSDVAAFTDGDATFSSPTSAERVPVAWVSGSAWRLLGVRALHGTPFGPESDVGGAEPVVVLSEALWRRRFEAAPNIVGRAVRMDGMNRRVVAVMPAGFAFPENAEAWLPLRVDPATEGRDARRYRIIARTRSNVGPGQANEEVRAAAGRLASEFPSVDAGWSARAVPFRIASVGQGIRPLLLIFQTAVGLVLLVACVNLVSLTMVRTWARSPELAMRAALGASPAARFALVASESILVALVASALSLPLAAAGLRALRNLIPIAVPAWLTFQLDTRAYLFAVVVALIAATAFGLAPALLAARATIIAALRDGGRAATMGARPRRMRRTLCAVQLALACLLVTAALQLFAAVQRMRHEPTGFETHGVVAVDVALVGPAYSERSRWTAYARRAVEVWRGVPGVAEVGVTNHLPLTGDNATTPIRIEGRAVQRGQEPLVNLRVVSPGYFGALRIPLLAGRSIGAQDVDGAARVAVVNATMARRLWGSDDGALAQPLEVGTGSNAYVVTVVGVVGDTKDASLGEAPVATLHLPFEQYPWPSLTVVARLGPGWAGTTGSITPALHDALRSVDPDIVLSNIRPADALVEESLWRTKLYGYLIGVFATVSVVLTILGVTGLASQSAAERRPEYAIRMALGASPVDLLRLVSREGAVVTVTGLLAGLILSWWASRVIDNQLFGVGSVSLGALAAGVLTLAVASTVAYLAPAALATIGSPGPILRATGG